MTDITKGMIDLKFKKVWQRMMSQFSAHTVGNIDRDPSPGDILIYHQVDDPDITPIIAVMECEKCKTNLAAKIDVPKLDICMKGDNYYEISMRIAINDAKIALLSKYNEHLKNDHIWR